MRIPILFLTKSIPRAPARTQLNNNPSLPLVVQVVDVKVGQDLSGAPSKGLYVEEVVVTASRGDEVTFPCHCWTGEDDKITVDHVQQTEEVPLGKCVKKRL